jgi:hypothetical protein
MREFGRDIWIADGPEVAVAGFHYPTRMAVIRLADGGLFVWSPIQLSDELRAVVDSLGRVAHIVAPNSLHHLFLAEWQRAYPGARLYAAPGLRKKRRDLAFDAELGDAPTADWVGEIDQVAMRGNLITTEIVFFHRASGTLLFTDLLQQIAADRLTGWRAVVARLDLMTEPEPSVPRKFRLAFVGRRKASAALERILGWPVDKVLMAHGTPVERDASAFLRRAFGWLVG